MTATDAAPIVQLTRSADRIDAAVALLSQPDGSIEDAAMLLRRIATADLDAISTSDPAARIQGLCAFVAQRLRDQWPDEVRVAAPAAVVEVVNDATRQCINPLCGDRVMPWSDSACSPECDQQAHRLGEV